MVTVRFSLSREPVEIIEGRRSKRDADAWKCSCGKTNPPIRKLVFTIPTLQCGGCPKKYLENHDIIFSLSDVTLNGEPLVRGVFKQSGPECMANSICQMVLIKYAMECIIKSKKIDLLNVDPKFMVKTYERKYPEMAAGNGGLRQPSSTHKLLKMMLWLKKEGFKQKDGSSYRISDYSYIPCTNYEALCEALADGEPLLTVFTPGYGFGKLEYCQLYKPPKYDDLVRCNEKHEEYNSNTDDEAKHSLHALHMVVLLGPATNCADQEKGFIFINSHGVWCPRNVVGDNKKAVKYGIGKIVEDWLICNAIKFWLPGEYVLTEYQFEEDDDEGPNKYQYRRQNRARLWGSKYANKFA